MKIKIIIILAVVLPVMSSVFYFLSRSDYVNFSPADQKVLAQLKKIILLPDNETPSMAVVMNAKILKKQQPEFFANVKNGDRLIIYPDLAILYDYNADKIIKVGLVQNVLSKNK